MRYTIASQALCGAMTVSALAMPHQQQKKRNELVDLTDFKSFPTIDPQEILDNADDAVREFFREGLFNDGPMDDLGNFIDRHVPFLDDLVDHIQDGFEDWHEDVQDWREDVRDGFEAWQDKTEEARRRKQQQKQKVDGAKSLVGTTSANNNNRPKAEGITLKANAVSRTCNPSRPHVRYEWSSYSRSDRTALVKAIKCLQDKPSANPAKYTGSRSRYEDLVSVHRGMTANIHQTAAFLVWHRYFVWVFEQMLREECAFDRALPWWDETKHAGNFAASDVFTDEWFGALPARTADGRGTCIENGEFSNTTLHVGPGPANQNHCLSRAADESQTAQCNSAFTNSCLSRNNFDDFRHCFELGPHGYGHNGIGAVMAEVSSSVGDPIFFLHHLFVDHTFRIWQNASPGRKTSISGCADVKSPCTPITLDTVLSSDGLRPDMRVRDVLDTLTGDVCYRYDY